MHSPSTIEEFNFVVEERVNARDWGTSLQLKEWCFLIEIRSDYLMF